MRRVVFCIFISLAISCGGKVQFVTDKQAAELPTQVAREQNITETFNYGQPVGTQVVALILYPRKSMQGARARLIQLLHPFLESLWNGAQGYRAQHFVVLRDTERADAEWFSPKEEGLPRLRWRDEAMRFLRASLSKLPIERERGESDALSPFDNFEQVVRTTAYQIKPEEGPIWINLYYFRDGDLQIDPRQEERFNASINKFQQALSLDPVSRFRTAIHLVSYLNPAGECDPLPSRISSNLQKLLAAFNGDSEELCHLLSNDPSLPALASSRLGNRVHDRDRRVILRRVPRLDTLQVSVKGGLVPRENIAYNESSNEISFREHTSPTPVAGDEIQVQYEATTP